jgi:hypothetical protein
MKNANVHFVLKLFGISGFEKAARSKYLALKNMQFREIGVMQDDNLLNYALLKMANTYTQIHIQFVFAVKYRRAVIAKEWKEELYKYINGIVSANGHKLLAINGVADHILIGVLIWIEFWCIIISD